MYYQDEIDWGFWIPTILRIIVFFVGLWFLGDGIRGIKEALNIETVYDIIKAIQVGSVGSLEVVIGIILIVIVLAPYVLRIFAEARLR